MSRGVLDQGFLQLIKQVIFEESERLGVRVEKIMLFGSRARREAREDSDWDILVVVKGRVDWRLFLKTAVPGEGEAIQSPRPGNRPDNNRREEIRGEKKATRQHRTLSVKGGGDHALSIACEWLRKDQISFLGLRY